MPSGIKETTYAWIYNPKISAVINTRYLDMVSPTIDRVASASLRNIQHSFDETLNTEQMSQFCRRLPPVSQARRSASLHESAFDLDRLTEEVASKDTVLYLAYGSNLSNETFRGKRGIKPIAQVNVQVPSLQVFFDLPGLPYKEPCFANSGRPVPPRQIQDQDDLLEVDNEKSFLLSTGSGYRKEEWRKGLIGVVYEVTAEDYAHIIATEGGGSSYQDILIECHPFASTDPTEPVPEYPSTPAFKAHTLFAPAVPTDDPPPKHGGRLVRPDRNYAQPSARYLKLMRDGAAEVGLPYEYQDHLESLRPYTITTKRQRLGQVAFLAIWGPIIALIFMFGRMFRDEQGKAPGWLRRITLAIFAGVWLSYDRAFKPLFGDGERTLNDDDKETAGERRVKHHQNRRRLHDGEVLRSEMAKVKVIDTRLV